MFPFFYNDGFGSHLTKFSTCQNDIGFTGEFFGFGIIDHEQVDLLNQAEQSVFFNIDPQIDGVGKDIGFSIQLIEHMHLQGGVDVPQEHKVGIKVRGWEVGSKVFEYIQLNLEGIAAIEVLMIFTFPKESGPGLILLYAFKIDTS